MNFKYFSAASHIPADLNEPIFLLRGDPYMYIENPEEIYALCKDYDFSVIIDKEYGPVCLNPSKCSIVNEAVIPKNNFNFNLNKQSLKLRNTKIPKIFIGLTKRIDMFKWSFKSILYSLNAPVEITLVVCGKDLDETLSYALELYRLGKVHEVLLIKENPIYTWTNFIVQKYADEDFLICCEDDFLMPESTKTLFPNWPYAFRDYAERGYQPFWAISFQNGPIIAENYHTEPRRRHGWTQVNCYAGQVLGYSPQTYKQTVKHFKSSFASDLMFGATGKCITPNLLLYHLGFDQHLIEEMPSTLPRGHLLPHPNINYIKSATKSEDYEKIDLQDIFN